ncbi:hypothetical protein DERP_003514 [Dermatophagoides pteronyssinus]|uniref:Uncharacterized protein n=1 Tax=Dermatophagoides pteronyssinus TaxID=6956 RepID=A0ABQ8JLP5_DERPT|nr:hypothetical protein DERP_003514 [Dermatophagoides pteronyssinus]
MLNLFKKNRPYNKLLYNHYHSKKVSPMIMIARMALLLIIAMIIIIAFIWFTNISSMLIQYIMAINLSESKDYSKMNIQQLIDELIAITNENNPEQIQSIINQYLLIRQNLIT